MDSSVYEYGYGGLSVGRLYSWVIEWEAGTGGNPNISMWQSFLWDCSYSPEKNFLIFSFSKSDDTWGWCTHPAVGVLLIWWERRTRCPSVQIQMVCSFALLLPFSMAVLIKYGASLSFCRAYWQSCLSLLCKHFNLSFCSATAFIALPITFLLPKIY